MEKLIQEFIDKWATRFYDKPNQLYHNNKMKADLAKLLEAYGKEQKEEVKCSKCDGHGYTSEHNDLSRNYETGEHDCSQCPIQVQCENCQATGKIKSQSTEQPKEKSAEEIMNMFLDDDRTKASIIMAIEYAQQFKTKK